MSIKNILCAYSGDPSRGSGLRHAVRIAKHHDAWVTAVLRHGRPILEHRFATHLPQAVIDQVQAADAAEVKDVADRFRSIAELAGISDRAEFVDLDPQKDGAIPEFSRNFDLVVTGTHAQDMQETHMTANPDLIALQSGRPVLVVPNGYEADGLAESALVAWDGKRSAARALGDAMPILEEKARVTVLTVGGKPVRDISHTLRNLERHGIEVEYLLRPRDGSVAETVQRVADEVGARLIVMGAFEHSRFTHSLVGGVTTDVMRDTTVPVFLSH